MYSMIFYLMNMSISIILPAIEDAEKLQGSRDGAEVRALTSHQCLPGLIPRPGVIIMWVEFVVGSLPCSKRFSPLLKNQHFLQIPIQSGLLSSILS